MVAVRDRQLEERLPAVVGEPRADVEDPDRLGVGRMRVDVVVVPGALAQVAVLAAALPAVAEVVGAEDRAVLGLDDRVHPAGLRRGRRDADLSEQAFGQPLRARDLRPRVAAVARAEEARSRPAGDELPRPADRLPEGRVHDPRVVRVDREVARARALAPIEDALPGLAAVARAVHASLGVRAVRVPERGHVCRVRVLGMHADLRDVPRPLETEVRPALARVGRAVHPIAVRHVAADAALAHAHVDDVRVGLRDRDRPDRRALEEAIGRVLPVHAAVERLPHAAASGSEIEGVALARIARDGAHAPAAIRPGAAPLEAVEEIRGLASRSIGAKGTAAGRGRTTLRRHGCPPPCGAARLVEVGGRCCPAPVR